MFSWLNVVAQGQHGFVLSKLHYVMKVRVFIAMSRVLPSFPWHSLFLWMRRVVALLAFASGKLQADDQILHPFCGIRLITRTETSPRSLIMHIAQIDLKAPGIRFKLTPPGGTRDTVRQTVLDFLNQEHAQLAVNAHFYWPFATVDTNANLAGLAVSEGLLYSPFEPQPLELGFLNQSYAIVPFGPALNIDRFNRASLVHRDPGSSDNRHVKEHVSLWNTFSGSAQIICDGTKSIPTYSGPNRQLNPGNGYSEETSWYDYLRARSVIGLTRDNQTLLLFTVDETGGSQGMTVGEVADLLICDYQVYNAINLDGDGSTSMAIEDPVTGTGRLFNRTSDGLQGRAVGSALAVFAQPLCDPIARLAIFPSGKDQISVSWPLALTSWTLERAATAAPGQWIRMDAVPQPVGGFLQVLLPCPPFQSFYRLVPSP